jgi:oligoendopeptidase F
MTIKQLEIPQKPERKFIPEAINMDDWNAIEPLLKNLSERDITNKKELLNWLYDRSEMEAVFEENLGWRYIKMTINTKDEEAAKSYEHFITNINPKISPYDDILNKKLNDSPYKKELTDAGYSIYFRGVKSAIELYRDENNDLFAKDAQLGQKYGAISGKMNITYQGKELTMQQAGTYLKNPDRNIRKEVFELTAKRRLEDSTELNNLLSEMIAIRDQVAKNANFDNFRDYKFKAMGRFDYEVKDCFDFHESIAKEIVPIVENFVQNRKSTLGYESLKPYDLSVSLDGKPPLQPFKSGEEMLAKTIELFHTIDTYCGERLEIMEAMNHLDLESKTGKAPGGYNYPLYEIGVPFIFMNSVGLQRDLVTMVHEGGHAVHSFLTRDLPLTPFKNFTSEVAELASMSMELISMEHWDIIYSDKEELKRAKKEQLEGVLDILPWVATVDAYQHWLYENPKHTLEERHEAWLRKSKQFSSNITDWSDYPDYQKVAWHRQMHIFEVPFYYIEYGMAQLGAIAVWRNYKQNPTHTMQQYKEALALGYTKSIPEVYAAAGIKFDFSQSYVSELAKFVKDELAKLD